MGSNAARNAEKAGKVGLVLLDADGVLTDGSIVAFADGNEARAFSSRDGLGIRLGQRAGLAFGVVSGRISRVVSRRAEELGFVVCLEGVEDKAASVASVAERLGYAMEQVCFVGDDLVDLPALRRAGFSAAPADADPRVRDAVDWVAPSGGGRGAVREIVEFVLRARGAWDEATRAFVEGV